MLDDNMSFLENIRMTIDDFENILLFDSPSRVIEFVTAANSIPECADILDSIDSDEVDFDNVLSVDYEKLASFFKRENQVSVLVVDYSMPEINGVEFFERVKEIQSKKIMLTGEADTTIALEVFNNGLIDKFLTKDISSINTVLGECINDFKIKYFLDSKINTFLSSFNAIKDDSNYLSVFNDWIKLYGVVKFHQADEIGSMIGIDSVLKTHTFYLLSENKLQDYIKVAEENYASSDLLDQFVARRKIPIFINDGNKSLSVKDWGKIVGEVAGEFEFNNNRYYYCFA